MAYVLSSISGNLISAASAGYAPTNSGDVSAIASAYQVVSSTATQLYAGTSYVTSINDAPISASRAGNAANASLANSAWYDGTGRFISALPDSAAVSAIASSYAESAASSKLDSSASSSFYPADNPSGFISSVDLSDYATTAYVDSSISGFAYDSAVSGWTAKQDALTFGYDTADKISSINGSSLAGEGGGGMVTAIGTSESGITSINNSGLVDTAALRSADYSSLYVQEPLYISASGDSSYIGISGTQVNADWAETASAAPSYIENKPDLVDIVAGPGIHIDNPDGNTLRVSCDSAYETVLWSGDALSATVSESLTNFDSVKVYAHWHYNGSYEARTMAEIPGSATNFNLFTITPAGTTAQMNNANVYTLASMYGVNSLNLAPINKSRIQYAAVEGAFSCNSYSNDDVLKLYKVVGIHRIANN